MVVGVSAGLNWPPPQGLMARCRAASLCCSNCIARTVELGMCVRKEYIATPAQVVCTVHAGLHYPGLITCDWSGVLGTGERNARRSSSWPFTVSTDAIGLRHTWRLRHSSNASDHVARQIVQCSAFSLACSSSTCC